jgi:DNA-binding NarL/FixJ family response regulator
MRVALIGSAAARARLRAALNGSFDVVAEFTSLAAARAADVGVDALMIADAREPEADLVEETLTAREIDVLERLAEGLSNKAIGAALGISDQTVKFHVAAIAAKLGAANRTDAVRRAVRRGLITL